MKTILTMVIAVVLTAFNAQADKPKLKPKEKIIEYPAHWGKPPLKQTRDAKYLPYPWKGWGSGTLVKWIKKNQTNYPKSWGKKPKIQTADLTELPGPYGLGSTTLKKWIQTNLDKDSK